MSIDSEFGADQPSLGEYLAMARRRKSIIIATAVIVFGIALTLAIALPAKYQSQATILIEEQEVPADFVRSTITNYADQQIQIINRRLMTVETISGIAEKFDLYRDEDGNLPPSTELVKRFAEDMNMQLVSAEVVDPRSGRPGEATIAFTLSYINGNPSTAQKVTNELVTLFLNENLRTRADKASSTAQFLAAEAAALQNELRGQEQRLADFKLANEGSLPELYQFNLSVVERSERELTEIGFRLQELGKRELELQSELSRLSPTSPKMTASGEVILSDTDRLEVLKTEYQRLTSVYTESHPDVLAVKREMEVLQKRLGSGQRTEAADNPAYVLLQTQLSSIGLEKRTLEAKKIELTQRIAKHENLIQRAPEVEKEYQAMLRDQQTTGAKYQELKAKQREAELAMNLEQSRKGQRFELVEPPTLPLEPVKPNRKAIVLLGFIMAFGCGFGLAYLKEASDDAVHGEKAVEKLVGEPLLGVVPFLENQQDQQGARRSLIKGFLITVVVIGILLLAVHWFVKPLDVVFYMIFQRFGSV